MGLFDLPAPVFAWLDSLAATVLSAPLRLMIWGAIGGLISMGLYCLLSSQRRIAEGKRALADARQRLDAFDGEFAEAMPLIRHLLATAFAQVGRVAAPAIVGSLPLLTLIAWLATAYGYAYPASGAVPAIHIAPEQLQAEWVAPEASRQTPRVIVHDTQNRAVAEVALPEPVPVIHKRRWWNALFGNPAGYIDDDAAVDRIRVELPAREYLTIGPGWLHGWELPFFLSLLVASVALKVLARIE